MERALCIGLNYTGSPYELPDCHLDADAITRRALSAGYRCDKYTGKFGANDFVAELVRLRSVAKKSDTTLIMYSGHGTQWWDVSSGERDYNDEGLCFWDGDAIEVFPDDDFRNLLNEIKGAVHVFLDCCFSGGMEREARKPAGAKKFVLFDSAWRVVRQKPSLSRAAASKNKIYFMFACAEGEVSWSTGTGGLFTKAFCEAYDRTGNRRTIKNLTTSTAGVCRPDQSPFYRCLGGNGAKTVF